MYWSRRTLKSSAFIATPPVHINTAAADHEGAHLTPASGLLGFTPLRSTAMERFFLFNLVQMMKGFLISCYAGTKDAQCPRSSCIACICMLCNSIDE